MKVEYSKKVLNFFCISELEKWRNLRKFLSFFHSCFFYSFALRKFFLQETFHIINNLRSAEGADVKQYKMKKRKNKRVHLSDPQPLEYLLSPDETLKVMKKGTDVSCKLVEVLIHSGKGVVGMCAAVFGLAKATVLIKELIARKGFDMTGVYNDVMLFFEEYAETEECKECFEKHGL